LVGLDAARFQTPKKRALIVFAQLTKCGDGPLQNWRPRRAAIQPKAMMEAIVRRKQCADEDRVRAVRHAKAAMASDNKEIRAEAIRLAKALAGKK
jgi:hypothetical protein